MLPRLDELEKDLVLRRKRAETEGWLGEIDGIDKTLAFLHAKRTEAQRLLRRQTVDLGLPAIHIPSPGAFQSPGDHVSLQATAVR